MDASDILKRMAILLRKGWCAGALARDSDGTPCGPLAKQAKSWCLLGAALRASEEALADHAFPTVRAALKSELWERDKMYLMWCDDRPGFTQADALNVVETLALSTTFR